MAAVRAPCLGSLRATHGQCAQGGLSCGPPPPTPLGPGQLPHTLKPWDTGICSSKPSHVCVAASMLLAPTQPWGPRRPWGGSGLLASSTPGQIVLWGGVGGDSPAPDCLDHPSLSPGFLCCKWVHTWFLGGLGLEVPEASGAEQGWGTGSGEDRTLLPRMPPEGRPWGSTGLEGWGARSNNLLSPSCLGEHKCSVTRAGSVFSLGQPGQRDPGGSTGRQAQAREGLGTRALGPLGPGSLQGSARPLLCSPGKVLPGPLCTACAEGHSRAHAHHRPRDSGRAGPSCPTHLRVPAARQAENRRPDFCVPLRPLWAPGEVRRLGGGAL